VSVQVFLFLPRSIGFTGLLFLGLSAQLIFFTGFWLATNFTNLHESQALRTHARQISDNPLTIRTVRQDKISSGHSVQFLAREKKILFGTFPQITFALLLFGELSNVAGVLFRKFVALLSSTFVNLL
jgi:hypothetical protein